MRLKTRIADQGLSPISTAFGRIDAYPNHHLRHRAKEGMSDNPGQAA
jgi:hypothetical protein